jgi:hypothetical protein
MKMAKLKVTALAVALLAFIAIVVWQQWRAKAFPLNPSETHPAWIT